MLSEYILFPRDFSVIYFSVFSMLYSEGSNRTFLRPQIKHAIKTKKSVYNIIVKFIF